MIVKFIQAKNQWEKFLGLFPGGSFLESWAWGEFQANLGKEIFRIAFFDASELKGIALLIKEPAKRGAYLACPAGPLFFSYKKGNLVIFTRVVKELAQAKKAWFIRVRPQLKSTPDNQELFAGLGFKPAPMHMHAETTWQLDLDDPEEKLFKNMKKSHRYEIRKSYRKGVKVVSSDRLEDVKLLYKFQLKTARKHGFVPFSKTYLEKEFKAFLKDKRVKVFKGIYKGKVAALAMVVFYGKEAVYHYASASQLARECSASYQICHQAIIEAKRRDLLRFNFWGIAPPGKSDHRFFGLNHFKMGFGGYLVEYLQAQDLVVNRLYFFTNIFERLRKLHRRL